MKYVQREIAIALFFGAITFLASPIFGQTNWTDATGDWFTAGNWDNGVPNSTTDANIYNGGTAQIGAAGATAQSISLGSNILGSGTLAVGAGGSLTASASVLVGDTGTGTLNITAGATVETDSITLGQHDNSVGTVLVDGAGSALHEGMFAASAVVGSSGMGTLTISNGATFTYSTLTVGNNGGNGTVLIQSGGTANTASSGAGLGNDSTAVGSVTVEGAGSTWTSGALDVGISGTGTLNINSGGVVTSTDSRIGVIASGTGTANVAGAGSTWTNSGDLTVGDFGTGTLHITSGGKVSDGAGEIGEELHAIGLVTVAGTGSNWTNSNHLIMGVDGSGTLQITNGGVVSDSAGTIAYGTTGSGAVTVSGTGSTWTNNGSVTVGYAGSGTLDITSGGHVTGIGPSTIGSFLPSTGIVTISGAGSSWINTGDLDVGADGTATLNINTGGALSNTNGYIGHYLGSGIATVDGTGSIWTNTGTLTVGQSGTGTLHITNGGAVTVNGSFARIGEQMNSTGIVTVDGAGSTWTLANELDVARAGTGTLTITNGGIVNMTGAGRASIGVAAGSNGTASVDGADSMWTLGGANLNVGEGGTGSLTISHSGLVRNLNGTLGASANATGTVTVDGTGSTWTNLGTLQVGNSGNGTLNILNGGAVISTDAFIAHAAGSTSLLVVNGTGGASTLQVSGNIFVGGDAGGPGGNGVLRVLNGGIVNSNRLIVLSTSTLEIGANPLITTTGNPLGIEYDGGTLKTIANTTFNNNGFLQAVGINLDSNGFTSTLGGIYSGAGGLTKINPGTIVLTNANTYFGNTNINGGSLIVDGSIGNSTTFVNSGGLLGGTGTVTGTVFNSGVVSPGHSPGTLNLGSSYVQNADGTLRIEIGGLAAPQHDLLAVNGAATLDGTLQILRLNNFMPGAGDRVTIITDAAGHTGTFDIVTGDFFGVLRPVPQYDEFNDVYVIFQLGSFNIGGLTPNQKSVAHNLDIVANDPAAAPLINFLVLEALANLPHDYDLIAPEELASIYEIGFSQAMVQNNNLQRRMDDIRAGSNGFCANGFTPQVSGKDYTKEADGKASLPDKATRDVYTTSPDNRWGVFVTGTGDFVNVGNDDVNAHGYDITTGDFTVGADYRLCDHFAIGIDAGYSHSTADLVDDGRVDVDGGKFGAYATWFGKGLFGSKFYVNGVVGGGVNDYDTRRTGLQNDLVRGDTDGTEFNAMISYGSDWTFGCFNVGTWSSVQFTNVSIDQFTETGSLAPLEIQDQDENSFRATTGVHASYDIKAGHMIFRPEVRAAYQHEYCDSAYQIDSRFASGAGDVFRVRGPRIGRDAALVGAGMSMQWNNRLSTYVYYDGVLGRNNYDNNAVSGGLRIGF